MPAVLLGCVWLVQDADSVVQAIHNPLTMQSAEMMLKNVHIGHERTAWSVTNCDSSPTATPAEMRTSGAPLLLCLHRCASQVPWHSADQFGPSNITSIGAMMESADIPPDTLMIFAKPQYNISTALSLAFLCLHAKCSWLNASSHPTISMRLPLSSCSSDVKITSTFCRPHHTQSL